MWQGCANLIVAAMSMKIMGSLLLTPSHTRWVTSMFTELQIGFAKVKFLSLYFILKAMDTKVTVSFDLNIVKSQVD
jgi:hypothetical protein